MELTLLRSSKRKHPLSDLECKNAQPKPKQYRLSDSHGLSLLIMPDGKKYWRMRYMFNGKQKQIAFGVYPEVRLPEARERLFEARKLIRDGVDPAAKRKAQRQLAKLTDTAHTFRELALQWHQLKAPGWRSRHAENIMSRLKNDVFPLFGDLPIDKVLPAHLRKLIDNIQQRGAHDIARRTLQYCGQIFTYAQGHDRIVHNPAYNLTTLLAKRRKQHFHAITCDELPEFIRNLEHNEAPVTTQTRLATKLLMLTFVRTKELVEAPWSEFNFDKARWIIPADRMKKGRDHIVPLSRQALLILSRLKELGNGSPWVFPARSYHNRHMSNGTILGGIKRMGYNQRMTGHGFRALATTTISEELKYPFHVVDTQLAHKQSTSNAPYHRAQYLSERERMMQDWADYIDRISPVRSDYEQPETRPEAA